MSILSLAIWATKNEPENSPRDAVDEEDITVVYVWEWFIFLTKRIWKLICDFCFKKWGNEAMFIKMILLYAWKGFLKVSLTKYLTYVLSFSSPCDQMLRPSKDQGWDRLLCEEAKQGV